MKFVILKIVGNSSFGDGDRDLCIKVPDFSKAYITDTFEKAMIKIKELMETDIEDFANELSECSYYNDENEFACLKSGFIFEIKNSLIENIVSENNFSEAGTMCPVCSFSYSNEESFITNVYFNLMRVD